MTNDKISFNLAETGDADNGPLVHTMEFGLSKPMTANQYWEYCLVFYNAMGYKTDGITIKSEGGMVDVSS